MIRKPSSDRRHSGPSSSATHASAVVRLPVLGNSGESADAKPSGHTPGDHVQRGYGRWRAATLSLVYILMVAHIVHWKIAGRTLAPLEFNEVMHTFELGVITAGFVFMCAATLATLVFGRFSCSWGCHIIALQDLCRWMLHRIGITPKPIRSRALLLVPPLTALYIFAWPQVERRMIEPSGSGSPALHIATDAEGWASFVTTDFWRNLPGPWIIALTFLVCGFVTVYVLGSRSFCTYVCPYGAVFGLADRFAPGRIRVDDGCEQCGRCTATCQSHVRVHEEVARYGMVVNPACMKDLDCVRGCPKGALHYGFGRPALLKSTERGRFGVAYDFTPAEELAVAGLVVVVVLIFHNLYGVTPFFLALSLGGMIGYTSVVASRLWSRPHAKLGGIQLKRGGRINPAGYAFMVCFVGLISFMGHSGLIRYHEFMGQERVLALAKRPAPGFRAAVANDALEHLSLAQRWGLFDNEMNERGMIRALLHLTRFEEAQTMLAELLDRHPHNAVLHVQLAECLVLQGKLEAAEREFRTVTASSARGMGSNSSAVASAHQWLGNMQTRRGLFAAAAKELSETVRLDPNRAAARAALGGVLAELGEYDEAVACLREALQLDPGMGRAHANLGRILAHLGKFAEAVPCYERALAGGVEDAELHAQLGFALQQIGDEARALEHLERGSR